MRARQELDKSPGHRLRARLVATIFRAPFAKRARESPRGPRRGDLFAGVRPDRLRAPYLHVHALSSFLIGKIDNRIARYRRLRGKKFYARACEILRFCKQTGLDFSCDRLGLDLPEIHAELVTNGKLVSLLHGDLNHVVSE